MSKTASASEIRKAYRAKALKWHPDRNRHRSEEARKRFVQILKAYEVLSDDHERAAYDRESAAPRPAPVVMVVRTSTAPMQTTVSQHNTARVRPARSAKHRCLLGLGLSCLIVCFWSCIAFIVWLVRSNMHGVLSQLKSTTTDLYDAALSAHTM